MEVAAGKAESHPTAGETKSPVRRWSRGVWLALALILLSAVAYGPAIQHGGFIWDDEDYVTENQTLRDLDGLKDIWTSPKATPQYYPLVHTGFWLEYQLWELDPTGYHITNVLLHALAAILLWRTLAWLAIPGAWLAAALFTVHPVHVESVAWVTERKNVLSAVFYMASALGFLKWLAAKESGERRPGRYVASLLWFVCALLSKTVACSLPAALLLVLWWKDGRAGSIMTVRGWLRDRLLPLLPFFALGIGLSLLTIWLEKHHVGAEGAEWQLSFMDRCLIAGRALWFYLSKLLWPSALCFNYPRWDIDASVWWQYLYPAAFGMVLVCLWLTRARFGRGPLVALLFFAGTLFPALGFIDVYPMRYSFVADHFQYLASLGVIVPVVACAARWHRTPVVAGQRAAGYIAMAVCLMSFVLISARQCGIYQNLETLWQDTIQKNPKSWMAYNNMGHMLLLNDEPEKAIPYFSKSIDYNPRELSAINNLGAAYARVGRFEEARHWYQRAMEIDPADARAYHNLGVALVKQGKPEQGIEYYRKALAIEPDAAAIHAQLGIVLNEMGRHQEALHHHRKAVSLQPEIASFHANQADTLMALGRIREAADHYRTAISLDHSQPLAHYQLGRIALDDQLIPAAAAHFRDALDVSPEFAQAYHGLAKALVLMGRIAEAGEYSRRAVRFGPDNGQVRYDHALFLAQHGDKAAARDEFLKVAELVPNDPNPVFQIALLEDQLGNYSAAEERFQQVLDMDPNHAPTCNHMAVKLAGIGKIHDAVALMRRAVASDPTNPEFQNNFGVMLVRAGNHADALVALREAVRLNPEYTEARNNLQSLEQLMRGSVRP